MGCKVWIFAGSSTLGHSLTLQLLTPIPILPQPTAPLDEPTSYIHSIGRLTCECPYNHWSEVARSCQHGEQSLGGACKGGEGD